MCDGCGCGRSGRDWFLLCVLQQVVVPVCANKVGYLEKNKKQKRTQKRVGLGESETEQFKNELKKKNKNELKKKTKKQTTHVSLMLGRCVTNAWQMTRFQRGHLMFKIPPGRDLFCGVKFCWWLCPGQRLRNRTSSASSFRPTPSIKLKLCVHRAPIPNPSPKHLCSRSCFGLRL